MQQDVRPPRSWLHLGYSSQIVTSDVLQRALARALATLLRPLVRLLLRHAVPYGAFDAVARRVYVEVALSEFALPGRKPTLSRASILTGLTRKAVQQVAAEIEAEAAGEGDELLPYNRAARVLGAWGRESRFRAPDGSPRPLEVDGEAGFSALVRSHSGDMPVRAVLDELRRIGAVEILEDGRVALRQRAFVPQASAARKVAILGADTAELVDTIAHNIEHGDTDARFQRKVMHRGIPREAVPEFRALAAARGQALLEELDAWLEARDLRHRPDLDPARTATARVGLGIFLVEQADPEPPSRGVT